MESGPGCEAILVSATGDYAASSPPSDSFAQALPVGNYLICQICGGALAPVENSGMEWPVPDCDVEVRC